MAALADDPEMPGVGFTEAFAFHDVGELDSHARIIRDGLDVFARNWGFRSETFTPPAQTLHPSLFDVAGSAGVLAIDKPFRCTRPMGNGTSRREFNCSGRQSGQGHVTVVRNVVFEPASERGYEPVAHAVQQVSAAFRWRRPAIISSHRVNFCGHLSESHRKNSLSALRALLSDIVQRWPDAEFVSVDHLVREMDCSA
ncbi:hypothetical protein [Alkalisalibacterium limincola]|uniref:Uncharacterized protein n=1 Tax=Alkalisalibacterium limincola TaxID=2699169 RepID=A0A5C8KZK8_9GAMM|nr:hypothetical protein [Alkalisalibacterium limincola]TXK65571.1 hypothetical protein FU658_00055 [Alkalisalibacterium limincola]